MTNWSFKNLNLKNVDVAKASNGIKPGRYVLKITDAEVKETKARGHQVVLSFSDPATGAGCKDFINVDVPSSDVATRIGLERLKAVYVYSGHPDPDNAANDGVSWLKGKHVGVWIEEEDFVNDKGETRKAGKPRKNGAYFNPEDMGVVVQRTAAGGQSSGGSAGDADLDDEIPF